MTTRRKKPRLFSFSREVEIANFEEVVTDPTERRVLEGMVDAFLEICRAQSVTAETLGAVAAAARHPSAYVRGVGITRLTVLSHWFEPAVAVLSSLLSAPEEGLRVFVAAALPNTPDTVAVPLLERALSDPSWRVRKTAAQACSAFAAGGLVPVLDAAVARETDARVKVQLALAREFQASPPGS